MIGDFELVERDGLARICRLETGHGIVETPAILPVINPNRKVISAQEMRSEFGIEMVITNSYIIHRTEKLRDEALRRGVHGVLDFDGPVMTDSGTFQTHVYSDVSVDPAGILEFQKSMGSDVATVFDVFSEPEFDYGRAENAVRTTRERVEQAMKLEKGKSLIAGTVQGGLYPDIRERAAADLSAAGTDYFSIGGVVPLLENYRFADLVRVVLASKKGLAPGKPVHLFGAGHPLMLPLAVLMGCDIFDSASYVKYAYDGRMMFPEGSYQLSDLRYNWCSCPVCTRNSLKDLTGMGAEEKASNLARHNLHVLVAEIKRIKQAIHSGDLWNLVESRARGNPHLHDAYAAILSQGDFTSRFEPLSRKTGIEFTDSMSLSRPGVMRFISAAGSVRPGMKRKLLFVSGDRQYLSHFDPSCAGGDEDVASVTRIGIFPMEMTETFPLAQSTYAESFSWAADTGEYAERFSYESVRETEGKWNRAGAGKMHRNGIPQLRVVAEYQFGAECAAALASSSPECTFSRNTGKLRMVSSGGRQLLFFRTEDGLFSLKFGGGEIVHAAVRAPSLRVVCSDDAVPFVAAGKSLFAKFALDADPGLHPGDECLVVDSGDRLVAVGRAVLTREEMLSFRKGVAVEVREGRLSSSTSQQPEGRK